MHAADDLECFKCGKSGHWSNACPDPEGGGSRSNGRSKSSAGRGAGGGGGGGGGNDGQYPSAQSRG
jgi:DNA topoisomerase-3